MLKFRCSQCGRKLGVPDEYAGRHVKCVGCGEAVSVPVPDDPEIYTPFVVKHQDPAPAAASLTDPWPEDAGGTSAAQTLRRRRRKQSRGRSTHNRRGRRKPSSRHTDEPRNKSFAVASLVLGLAVLGLYFAPWLNVLVAEVAPSSYVFNVVAAAADAPSDSGSSRPTEPQPEAAMSDIPKEGVGGLMLAFGPFIYTAGLVTMCVGAFLLMQSWRSVTAVAGFAVCVASCLLILLGWRLIFSDADARQFAHAAGAAGYGLTPWFYAALVASALGLLTSWRGLFAE